MSGVVEEEIYEAIIPRNLYHVTFLQNVDSIAESGLVPGTSSTFGGGYAAHASRRVFLTEWDGVFFWMSRMEDTANSNSDFNQEEDMGWSPVVLRLPDLAIEDEEVFLDQLGTRDSGGSLSLFVKETIDPDWIEVWDGKKWVYITEVDSDAMLRRAVSAADFVREETDEDEDEDSEEGYWEPNLDLFMPTKE